MEGPYSVEVDSGLIDDIGGLQRVEVGSGNGMTEKRGVDGLTGKVLPQSSSLSRRVVGGPRRVECGSWSVSRRFEDNRESGVEVIERMTECHDVDMTEGMIRCLDGPFADGVLET